MKKNCPKCNQLKLAKEFYLRKTGPRAGEYYEKCKLCMKIRGRSYYHLNRDRQLPLAIARKHRGYLEKRKFVNLVKDRPCADCGVKYPFYVMDLDHRDRTSKVNNVSSMMQRNWALEKIKIEVEKCDIVCANCHRIRTYHTFNVNAEIA